jgi:TonB family protein
VVIIEATTDSAGKVIDAQILRSIPLLDDAALTAVKQWIYEPFTIDGKKRGVIFTVTVRFSLNSKDAPLRMTSGERRARQEARP